MKNGIKIFISSIAIIIVGILGGLYMGSLRAPAVLGAGTNQPIYSGSTNSTVNVTSTLIQVLAANSGRASAEICQLSTNQSKWLAAFPAGTTPTTTVGAANYFATSTGRLLAPGTCYSVDVSNLFTSAIWAVSATSTTEAVSVMEFSGR